MKQLTLFLLIITAGCNGSREENTSLRVTTSPDFDKVDSFFNERKDSAFYYLNKFVDHSKDSLQIAMAYNYMAVIQQEAGDYFGSQESLLESLKHLNEDKKDDYYALSSDYTILGNNCGKLKNYDAAITYYDLGLRFAIDSILKMFALNGKAVAYQNKQEYTQAIAIYNSIINQHINNKKEYARILSNLARAKWLHDPGYRALPEFLVAVQIRQHIQDNWGLNASYAHLSDYYSGSQPDSAFIYADKMLKIAKLINSPDDELEALGKLIKLSESKDLHQYINRYQYLNDSIQTARNAAKNQFALIRYDAEKNKADNLVLQKDNAEKRIQIIKQRIFLFGSLFVLVTLTVIAILWYRKRKQQIEGKARERELKTSQKVHDVVANSIYRIMTNVEHQHTIEKELLLDELEDVYEKSRNITYEQPESSMQGYQKKIADLLVGFSNTITRVCIVGNYEELWEKVTANIRKELQVILTELMVNMRKHSQAKNVTVRFEKENDQLLIMYQDDGIGLPPSFQYGNGLRNTENRIKANDGQIIFEKPETNGLRIRILFPLTQN